MKRLFGCTVQLTYKEETGEATVNTLIADRTEFWWNERKPGTTTKPNPKPQWAGPE